MRKIDEDIWMDDWFMELNPFEKILWLGCILSIADDQGRFPSNPKPIRARLFPDEKITTSQIEKAFSKFARDKRVTLYSGNGKKLLQLNNWWKYQGGANYMAASPLPKPPNWWDEDPVCQSDGANAIYSSTWIEMKKRFKHKITGTWAQRGDHVGTTSQPRAAYTNTNPDSKTNTNDSDSGDNQPSTKLLPSGKPGGRVAGSNGSSEYYLSAEFKSLPKTARAELQKIGHMMSLVGLGKDKLESLLPKVAIRRKDRIRYVLAALASSYDDPKARNKAMITFHRIEKDAVPAQYFSPDLWGVIPDEIIKAAGKAAQKKDKSRREELFGMLSGAKNVGRGEPRGFKALKKSGRK